MLTIVQNIRRKEEYNGNLFFLSTTAEISV